MSEIEKIRGRIAWMEEILKSGPAERETALKAGNLSLASVLKSGMNIARVSLPHWKAKLLEVQSTRNKR